MKFAQFFLVFFISFLAQSSQAQTTIEVLDFYGTHRCATCIAIEKNTRYTLETYFADELKSGKIVFKTIQCEDEKNAEIVEKCGAYGTSLILDIHHNGKEKLIDWTNFAFMKARKKDSYSKALKEKLEKQLEKLK